MLPFPLSLGGCIFCVRYHVLVSFSHILIPAHSFVSIPHSSYVCLCVCMFCMYPDNTRLHDSAMNNSGGTWGNLEHLYGQHATTATATATAARPSSTGGISGGGMSKGEDDDDSRYNIDSDDDDSKADGSGRAHTPQDRFSGYSDLSLPDNDVAGNRFSVDGEDDDRDLNDVNDDDDTEAGRHSALSLDVTERMSNRMLEPDRVGGVGAAREAFASRQEESFVYRSNVRAPPREAFASNQEESFMYRRSLIVGGGKSPGGGVDASTSLAKIASSMFGQKPKRRAMPNLDEEEDDFVYYDGAQKKNKITLAKARPTIRAILLTVALLLSTYVALGCNFITVDVGFEPENLAVQSTFDLGLWSYPPSATGEGGGKCLKYPDAFTKEFIAGDPMWVFSRASSLLVLLMGWASLILAWLLAIKRPRLKPTLPYKAALAFMATLMLLFQCLCFVFLQISLCTDEVWMRTSESSGKVLTYRADSCKLSKEGNMAIGSLLLYFVLVVALCRSRLREQMEHNVKAAGKRAAQMHYGNMLRRRSSTHYVNDDDDELESLGFGEEELKRSIALDQALSMLESRRFDFAPSDSSDSEMEDESRSGATGDVSTLTYRMGGHDSGNFGGLETLNEEDEEEDTPSEDTDFEDVPIEQDRELASSSKSWQSDRSGLSAMSGYS